MIIKRIKQVHLKKKYRIILSICVFVICLIFAVPFYKAILPTYDKAQTFVSENILSQKKRVTIGGSSILVDIADTDDERAQGLSGQTQLANRSGMLFIFDKPGTYGFWMKDMNFAIDIIWFNEYGEIIYIVQEAQPESYPETFMPPKASLYVLEVPSGFVAKEKLKIGDKIDL